VVLSLLRAALLQIRSQEGLVPLYPFFDLSTMNVYNSASLSMVKSPMWHPFRKPEAPRLIKRISLLEVRATDVEDIVEKILYQQNKLMGKINARHKKQIEAAAAALEGSEDITTPNANGLNFPAPQGGDLKAHLRARANELRRR